MAYMARELQKIVNNTGLTMYTHREVGKICFNWLTPSQLKHLQREKKTIASFSHCLKRILNGENA